MEITEHSSLCPVKSHDLGSALRPLFQHRFSGLVHSGGCQREDRLTGGRVAQWLSRRARNVQLHPAGSLPQLRAVLEGRREQQAGPVTLDLVGHSTVGHHLQPLFVVGFALWFARWRQGRALRQ